MEKVELEIGRGLITQRGLFSGVWGEKLGKLLQGVESRRQVSIYGWFDNVEGRRTFLPGEVPVSLVLVYCYYYLLPI